MTTLLILALLIEGYVIIVKRGLAAEEKISEKRWREANLDQETRQLLRAAGYPV